MCVVQLSPNYRIWDELGINPQGYAQCDAAMPHLMEAINLAGDCFDRILLQGKYQVQTLPTLTKEAQKKYAWKPIKEKS